MFVTAFVTSFVTDLSYCISSTFLLLRLKVTNKMGI